MAKTSGGNRGGGGGSDSAKLRKALKTEEAKIRNNNYETGIVLGSNGKVLLRKRGDEGQVGFTQEEIALMKDQVFTHNHPSGNTDRYSIGHAFSGDDYASGVNANVKEIRAVTKGYTFSMKRPKDGWKATPSEIKQAYNKIWMEHAKDAGRYMRNYKGNKKLASARADILIAHKSAKDMAKKFGWKYTRYSINK